MASTMSSNDPHPIDYLSAKPTQELCLVMLYNLVYLLGPLNHSMKNYYLSTLLHDLEDLHPSYHSLS
jgi:hypothetical protein